MFEKWQGRIPWSNKRIYKLLRHRSLISSGWFLSQVPSKSQRREEGRRWHCDVVVQPHGQFPWSNRWFPENGPVDSKEGWTETRRLCRINLRRPWLDEEQRCRACWRRCSSLYDKLDSLPISRLSQIGRLNDVDDIVICLRNGKDDSHHPTKEFTSCFAIVL